MESPEEYNKPDFTRLPKVLLNENGELEPISCIVCGIVFWIKNKDLEPWKCSVCLNAEFRRRFIDNE